uniref:Uncharacterized protein n=1 Tax=Romanomermis culicivorax TaxID=13658 RepID=A0A915JBN1_ROMCU
MFGAITKSSDEWKHTTRSVVAWKMNKPQQSAVAHSGKPDVKWFNPKEVMAGASNKMGTAISKTIILIIDRPSSILRFTNRDVTLRSFGAQKDVHATPRNAKTTKEIYIPMMIMHRKLKYYFPKLLS